MNNEEFEKLELGQNVWLARSTSIEMYQIVCINYPRKSNQPRFTKRTVALQSQRDSHAIDLVLPDGLYSSFFKACKAVVEIGEENDNYEFYNKREEERVEIEMTGSEYKGQ